MKKMHFSSKIILQLRKNIFFRAHAIEEALRKDRYSAEKGTESTKKGEGEQQQNFRKINENLPEVAEFC